MSDGERPTVRRLARSVVTAVRSRPPAELAVVFLAVPTMLVAVAAAPGTENWRFSLAAEGVLTGRWTLWTAFASSFVHTSTGHLVDNVVNYWLVMGVAYPLSVIAGWRRRLAVVAVGSLVVVPVVSAWATLVTLGDLTNASAAGFSDLNNALLGYLLVVWFAALATEQPGSAAAEGTHHQGAAPAVDPRWAFVAALASLAVVFAVPSGVTYFPPRPGVAVPLAAGAGGVALHLIRTRGHPRIVGLDLSPERELLYVTGASVVVAGVVGSLVVVPFGSNAYAHLVGYLVGLAAALGALVTADRWE
ncbi:hypothetical protein JCM17823_07580 [Halorubrum gandharaense]